MTFQSSVKPDTSLGRFLTQHNHFSLTRHEVKFKAFMPPPDLKLSVFRIDGLYVREIWDLGNSVISQIDQKRRFYGIADIKVAIFERESLAIDPDNIPERHANIIGWPEDQEKQLSIAQILAAEAILLLKE